ncbi:MAG: hypothetical protein KC476_04570 [Cyanobacteria bacterium HKST-UBA06]|nr:hypothetical protein [Cyanobacteria bacterium HKST-UBA06]
MVTPLTATAPFFPGRPAPPHQMPQRRRTQPGIPLLTAKTRFGETAPSIEGLNEAESKAVCTLFDRTTYGINPYRRITGPVEYSEYTTRLPLFNNHTSFDNMVGTTAPHAYGECAYLTALAYQSLKPALKNRFDLRMVRGTSKDAFNHPIFDHFFLVAFPRAGDTTQRLIIDPTFKKAGLLDKTMQGYKIIQPMAETAMLDEARQNQVELRYGQYIPIGFVKQVLPELATADTKDHEPLFLGFMCPTDGSATPPKPVLMSLETPLLKSSGLRLAPLDAILQESPLQPFNAYCRALTDLIQPETYFTRDDVQATDKSAS